MHAAIAAAIFAATLLIIVVRPRRISEAWAAAAGAVLMVVTASVSPAAGLQAVAGEWNLFLFFLRSYASGCWSRRSPCSRRWL